MERRSFHYTAASAAWAVLLVLLLAACAGPRTIQTSPLPERKSKPRINTADLEKQIHRLINEERQKQGLGPLQWNDTLSKIARKHSRDMAKRNYFEHVSPEGHDFLYRYAQEGYRCSVQTGTTIHMGAENIALNNLYDSVTTINGEAFYDWNSQKKLAETTVQGWMNSPGHRKNILMPYWKNEGIGVIIAPKDKVYITQNFC
jgi:uncharacterized protein YkwD